MGLFSSPKVKLDIDEAMRTAVHEIGHYSAWSRWGDLTATEIRIWPDGGGEYEGIVRTAETRVTGDRLAKYAVGFLAGPAAEKKFLIERYRVSPSEAREVVDGGGMADYAEFEEVSGDAGLTFEDAFRRAEMVVRKDWGYILRKGRKLADKGSLSPFWM